MNNYSKKIAQAGLEINAIKLNPNDPFEWSSGYKMPIYNDNRRYLFFPEYRNLIVEGFLKSIEESGVEFEVVAGVSTGGIPWGSCLADRLEKPFVYVRGDKKSYGSENQIEGIEPNGEVKDKNVLMVEDLISTGSSVIEAINVVRSVGAKVEDCMTIFDYKLSKSKENFSKLKPNCDLHVLLTYDRLLNIAVEEGEIKEGYLQTLRGWSQDPFNWWKD